MVFILIYIPLRAAPSSHSNTFLFRLFSNIGQICVRNFVSFKKTLQHHNYTSELSTKEDNFIWLSTPV